MSKFPGLRDVILNKLLESFPLIRSAKSHRAAIWILGEYCNDISSIQVGTKTEKGIKFTTTFNKKKL